MPFVKFMPGRAVAYALALGLTSLFTTPAFAALPAEVSANIQNAAAGANAVTLQESAVGSAIGEKSLQWLQARRAQDSSSQALSVVVATAIARYPHLTAEIVATAVAAAPASRDDIARQTARNFPGFAGLIYQAAGSSPGRISRGRLQPPARLAQSRAPVRAVLPVTTGYRSTPVTYNPSYRISTTPMPPAFRAPALRPQAVRPQAVYPQIVAVQPPTAPAAPAAQQHDSAEIQRDEMNDPIEGFNRAVFAVNDALDTMILRPVAAIYGYLMPNPAKPAARRFFRNLTSPVIMINDLVQFDGTDAAVTAGRFVVNSTVGVLGLFDVAADFGLPPHHADFGQSLHSYGVDPGPYIVLPLLGPSTLRDGTGQLVDYAIDPFNHLLNSKLKLARTAGSTVVKREDLIFPLDELRSSSVDYYSALRSAFYQNRVKELRKGRSGGAAEQKETDDLFDSSE
jgi:phospholipid-binding lipoprotein MlaA